MKNIAIARAAHLSVYIDILRDLGAPVERELIRSRLPGFIEGTPDEYVCVQFAFDFLSRCGRDATIGELGFLAAERCNLAMLHRDFQLSLLAMVSGLEKFESLVKYCGHENTALDAKIVWESSRVRVICDLEQFRASPAVAYGEWLIQKVLISVGRSVAGPRWCPSEMTFMSRHPPCAAALEAFADCRLLTGQPHTSIAFPMDQFAAPRARPRPESGAEAAAAPAPDTHGDGFVSKLRRAIQPYFAEGYPDIGLAAEIAGLSQRTLQRELARHGRTYSDVVREGRFVAACGLLGDPALKIIDVAFATGYANPQHFSRAFRQLAGISPRAYRRREADGNITGQGMAFNG